MVEPEVIRQIREFSRLGWGAKRISVELGLARNTVRRYRGLSSEEVVRQVRPAARCLDTVQQAEAERLLGDEAEGNAVVVHRLLAADGAIGSLRTVQRVVAPARVALRRSQVATVRFETAPGEQMQIDFGQKWVKVGGNRVRVYVFVAVLGYSRRIFVRALLSERQDDWHEGIVAAFECFGGTVRTLLIDNPKAMVVHHNVETRQVTLHPSFAAFCKDLGVAVRACAPYRARTKGKTESGVKYVKRNGLAGLKFANFAALQAHLDGWMQLADSRKHGTTGEVPSERFEANERPALGPLPQRSVPVRQRRLTRKVANDTMVNVDSIRYSVPHRFVGTQVDVVVGDTEVCAYAGSECVARHRRSTEPHGTVVDPSHYDGLLRRPAKAKEPAATSQEALAATMGRSLEAYAAVVHGGQP